MDSGRLLTERVADQIVRDIIGNQLKPGDKLPNEFDLAAKLGVGRSTIREAVKTLVSRSIVEIRRGSGTFVSHRSGVSEDPLGLAFLPDRTRVAADLLELRFMIEPRLASLAAGQATQEQMKEMAELCQQCEQLLQAGEDFSEVYTMLHAAIARASGNVVVPNLAILLCSPSFLGAIDPNDDQFRPFIETHQDLVRAICARDGNAAYDAMNAHLSVCRRHQAHRALQ